MKHNNNPLKALKHHVTGSIDRGEAKDITSIIHTSNKYFNNQVRNIFHRYSGAEDTLTAIGLFWERNPCTVEQEQKLTDWKDDITRDLASDYGRYTIGGLL